MNEHELVRLKHMLDAAKEAVNFMQGQQRHDLDENRLLALAETRLIEIIGEAAKNISDEGKKAHPEIEWSTIIGMRNRIVHNYSN